MEGPLLPGWNSLAPDTKKLIFEQLPPDALAVASQVCKEWNDLGINERLWTNHINQLRSQSVPILQHKFHSQKQRYLFSRKQHLLPEKTLEFTMADKIRSNFPLFMELEGYLVFAILLLVLAAAKVDDPAPLPTLIFSTPLLLVWSQNQLPSFGTESVLCRFVILLSVTTIGLLSLRMDYGFQLTLSECLFGFICPLIGINALFCWNSYEALSKWLSHRKGDSVYAKKQTAKSQQEFTSHFNGLLFGLMLLWFEAQLILKADYHFEFTHWQLVAPLFGILGLIAIPQTKSFVDTRLSTSVSHWIPFPYGEALWVNIFLVCSVMSLCLHVYVMDAGISYMYVLLPEVICCLIFMGLIPMEIMA